MRPTIAMFQCVIYVENGQADLFFTLQTESRAQIREISLVLFKLPWVGFGQMRH